MSLQTPSTKDIGNNIIAQLEATLGQAIPLLPKSFMRVLAKALSGVFILLYKYAGYTSLQQFVRTASIDRTEINGETVSPLLEWGRLVGVGDPLPASRAELLVRINVDNPAGSLPSGSQLVGAGNGVTYITIGPVALDAPTVQVVARAMADQSGGGGGGAIGNLDPGAVVSFANPLSNVSREATVVGQNTTGADGESTAAYRQRVLGRFQRRPQGGAYADYEQWGEAVAGIANVYPYTSLRPGQVDIYVEATVASSGDPGGIPTPAQLQAVLDAVELNSSGIASRRPAGALVNAFPIARAGFDVQVTGLDVADPAQVKADVEAELSEFFRSREPFIPGLSVPPRRDRVTAAEIGGAVSSVVSANAGIFSDAILRRNGAVISAYSLNIGEKAELSGVTF